MPEPRAVRAGAGPGMAVEASACEGSMAAEAATGAVGPVAAAEVAAPTGPDFARDEVFAASASCISWWLSLIHI